MENPFEHPSVIDTTLDEEIKQWIINKIGSRNFNFHDALDKLQECTNNGNKKKSKIWAYYCTNMILTNKSYDDNQKAAAIVDIREIVDNC